jgi:hypothetical protein
MGTRTIVPAVYLMACIALASPARGQTAVDPLDIVQFPATQPRKPIHLAPPAAPQTSRVRLRTLQAIQDAAQSQSHWQDAAKQAEDRLADAALRQKLHDRLNLLAPDVAAALLNQPGALAVVSIAVYTDPATHEQQSVAVAFEGLDGSLSPSFFPRLLADMPFPADLAKRQNRALAFDPAASSCMIYSVSKGDLDAEDITLATLKQSLGQALTSPPADSAVLAAAAPPDFPQRLPPPTATETLDQARHAQAVQDRAISEDSSAYDASGIDTSSWGQPPVYTPHWITIDIPDNSAVGAPAATVAPAAPKSTAGATPPRVGSNPKNK